MQFVLNENATDDTNTVNYGIIQNPCKDALAATQYDQHLRAEVLQCYLLHKKKFLTAYSLQD